MNNFFKSRSWWWIITALGAVFIMGVHYLGKILPNFEIFGIFVVLYYAVVIFVVVMLAPNEKLLAGFLSAQPLIVYPIVSAMLYNYRYVEFDMIFGIIVEFILLVYLYIMYRLLASSSGFNIAKELLLPKYIKTTKNSKNEGNNHE